jgi:hypothetical protein
LSSFGSENSNLLRFFIYTSIAYGLRGLQSLTESKLNSPKLMARVQFCFPTCCFMLFPPSSIRPPSDSCGPQQTIDLKSNKSIRLNQMGFQMRNVSRLSAIPVLFDFSSSRRVLISWMKATTRHLMQSPVGGRGILFGGILAAPTLCDYYCYYY